ncbi:hypothetical protein [Umezawaea sp.]|uniref:hypothetical protein n=1 Tax=Umezawaea sp. TaxID=1955258 RepID=UPI002ED2F12C
MTQPPPDPYGSSPYQPVNYPAAGQQPPVHQPFPQRPFPGAMRGVDQNTSQTYVRPAVVTIGFVLWLLTALSWPLGTLLRELVAGSPIGGFGVVMGLFFLLCLGIAGVVGAIMFLRGSYHARLALCGVALIVEVMAVIGVASLSDGGGYSGAAEVVAWLVALARLVLPPVAVVVSLLPGTRQYFAANLG